MAAQPSDSGCCGDPAQRRGCTPPSEHSTLGGPPQAEARTELAAPLTLSGCGLPPVPLWQGGLRRGGDPGHGVPALDRAPHGGGAAGAGSTCCWVTRSSPHVAGPQRGSPGATNSLEQGRRRRRPGLVGQGAAGPLASSSLVGFASSLPGDPPLPPPRAHEMGWQETSGPQPRPQVPLPPPRPC